VGRFRISAFKKRDLLPGHPGFQSGEREPEALNIPTAVAELYIKIMGLVLVTARREAGEQTWPACQPDQRKGGDSTSDAGGSDRVLHRIKEHH
jgi:hypothetical protein